jgi:hypothetical protein
LPSYVQWSDAESYVATQSFTGFPVPDVHLFEIFAEEPENSRPLAKMETKYEKIVQKLNLNHALQRGQKTKSSRV